MRSAPHTAGTPRGWRKEARGHAPGGPGGITDFAALDENDRLLEPAYTAPSSGGLPSRCASLEKEVCRECRFEDALSRLQDTRYRLEKLRRVYASAKALVQHGLATRDSLAGATGLGGIAWTTERTKVLKSFKGVQQSYDAKYAELMARSMARRIGTSARACAALARRRQRIPSGRSATVDSSPIREPGDHC